MRRESDSPYPHKNTKSERIALFLFIFVAGRENRKERSIFFCSEAKEKYERRACEFLVKTSPEGRRLNLELEGDSPYNKLMIERRTNKRLSDS